jgi:hypothetical protein
MHVQSMQGMMTYFLAVIESPELSIPRVLYSLTTTLVLQPATSSALSIPAAKTF